MVTEDQKQLQAHKIVLTACSGYFENILRNYAHPHPLLCLDEIKAIDLNYVLDYIYYGEVQMHQEHIERFMKIAQKLQLSGISDIPADFDENEKNIKMPILESVNSSIQEEIPEESYDLSYGEFQPAINKKKIDLYDRQRLTFHVSPENKANFESLEELDIYIDSQFIKTEGGNMCNFCQKISRKVNHIKEHIETHIKGMSFICNVCENVTRTRNGFRKHKANCVEKSLSDIMKDGYTSWKESHNLSNVSSKDLKDCA